MTGALSWPFLRLYLLTLLYFSANAILNVIIPLQGERLGATNSAIGLIMGAYMMTTMLFRPWAGQMIQRYGPIRLLRIILLLNGIALLLYTWTGLSGYFAARMLQGISTAFFSMTLQIGIIEALPEQERSQGISLYSLCSYMPGIAGPILALAIWQDGELRIFNAVMPAIAITVLLVGWTVRMGHDQVDKKPAAATEGASVYRALDQLIWNPHLRTCSILMLSASMVFGSITAYIPLFASQVPSGSAGIYLMLQAGTVVLARFVLRKRIPSDGRWHSSLVVSLMLILAAAACCVSLSATWGAYVFYPSAVLMGIAQAMLYPTLMTYLTFVLPQSERSVWIGLFIATADLGVSLGSVLLGPVADWTSYTFMFAVSAVLAASVIPIAAAGRGTS